jgi:acyl dehydratase
LNIANSLGSVTVGTELPEIQAGPLDRLAFARISVALDDPNLVHLDETVAREAGFPGVIGSGGIVIGMLYEVARQWAGIERIISGQTRQLVPFPANVSLRARGHVTAIEDVNSRREAICTITLVDQHGTTIGHGDFRVLLS